MRLSSSPKCFQRKATNSRTIEVELINTQSNSRWCIKACSSNWKASSRLYRVTATNLAIQLSLTSSSIIQASMRTVQAFRLWSNPHHSNNSQPLIHKIGYTVQFLPTLSTTWWIQASSKESSSQSMCNSTRFPNTNQIEGRLQLSHKGNRWDFRTSTQECKLSCLHL